MMLKPQQNMLKQHCGLRKQFRYCKLPNLLKSMKRN